MEKYFISNTWSWQIKVHFYCLKISHFSEHYTRLARQQTIMQFNHPKRNKIKQTGQNISK
jgi:hypothetical protein